MTSYGFVCREVPAGIINGTNAVFTLSNTPTANTEQVFLNGILQNVGAGNDYTISGNTITFAIPPIVTDVILVNYTIDVTLPTPPTPGLESSASRRELINWCLKRLGAPVIEINVAEEQIEDRIDEALLYFRDYHYDGVERCYLHYQITASVMTLESAFLGDVLKNDLLTGLSSGAVGIALDKSVDNKKIRYVSQNNICFIPGETVKVESTGDTFEILNSPTAIILGDADNKYINVGKKVVSITNIIPQESSTIGGNLGGIFDFQYQFSLHNMFNLASTDLVTYDIYKNYISLWEFLFRGKKGLRFNRKTDKVYIDVQNWNVGQWIVLEAWVALDPEEYKEVYSDEFVREYAYNLIKMQWGNNLKKFSGVQLPGGITLNGQQIYDEAVAELDKLRERVRKEFELPPDMQVG